MTKKQKINILITAAELTPIAKVGGLGDVIGSLPKALVKIGVNAKIAIPFYGFIDSKKYNTKLIAKNIQTTLNNQKGKFSLYKTSLQDSPITVYLIKQPFFNNKEVYLSKRKYSKKQQSGTYTRSLKDIYRFGFFSKMVIEICKIIQPTIDIIHCNDWHTALVPVLLKTIYKSDQKLSRIKTLYTIHNLANQGIAELSILKYLGLSTEDLKSIKEDAKNYDINFMAQGILNADIINTVSPNYAREILTKEFGQGLERLLIKRRRDLFGILNGIDVEVFNPKTDTNLYKNYDLKSLDKKVENKIFLQKTLGLSVDPKLIVFGVVSRLVYQKGLGLILDTANDIFKRNVELVVLGTGQKEIESGFIQLQKKYPNKISTNIRFDTKLAQQIYAGADAFLMPSRFEPCGLGQMIAMRYGTIPIVRSTGGLKNTVQERKTGFLFKGFNKKDFLKALGRALKIYYNKPKKWKELQLNGMKQDFSWERSAKEYLNLYIKLINRVCKYKVLRPPHA